VRVVDRKRRAWDVAQSEKSARAVTTERSLEHIVSARPQTSPDSPRAFGLSDEERELYLRVVADSLQIQRHYQLFHWLQGKVQTFVPHEIFVCAWGDFSRSKPRVDLISRLPGVRTSALARCDIDALLNLAHARWLASSRMPVPLSITEVVPTLKTGCACPIHSALRGMGSAVVHGVRDARGGPETLYLALYSGSLARGRSQESFIRLVDALVAPIDIAFRKIDTLPSAERRAARKANGGWLDLSIREQEILSFVCSGKRNVDIAAALSISPFTVKNHVQRIFRKLGVVNRTEAAARYNQAQRAMDGLL
jgi:transcriptional regulator EpsA